MCRLALFNKQGEKELNIFYGLSEFFEKLEAANGGHGNGYALIKDCKVKIRKGVTLTCEQMAHDLQKQDYDWAIFHTRIASVGSATYKNCHPFRRGDSVIAMNGTERDVKFLAQRLGMTDTEIILVLAHKLKIDISDLVQDFNSVFVGFDQAVPFVSAQGGYTRNLKYYQSGEAIVFASEFPNGYMNDKSIYPSRPFYWEEGMGVKEDRFYAYKSTYTPKQKVTNSEEITNWYEKYKLDLISKEEEEEEKAIDEEFGGTMTYGWDI